MNVPDEPRPVPAGMSATLTISSDGPIGMQLERRPDDRMLDLVDLLDALERGVLEEVVVGERPVDRDIDVPVDRGGDDEAAVPRVVRGEVGSAAADRDPERCTGYQHGLVNCPPWRGWSRRS